MLKSLLVDLVDDVNTIIDTLTSDPTFKEPDKTIFFVETNY